jgi:cell wall-associated NlpC family hydrolase
MKHLISGLTLLVALPSAANAQINIDFSGSRPVLRADVAGITVLAGLDPRGRLDIRVDELRTTRTTGGRTPTEVSRRSRTTRATADAVLTTASGYVGTRYVWGGATPNGFDCSGFVQYVFRQHGVELPRTSRQQAVVGQVVAPSIGTLQVGDLMLFATNGTRIDHVAIYAGDGRIIHSSSSAGGVGYDDFTTKRGTWFLSHHVATRRVLIDGQSLVGALTAALRTFTEFDPPDRAPRR